MRRRSPGQALVEFSLVIPMVMVVLLGIIVVGLWIFYQAQVTNVAREAARFAAIHSATAPCPTSGWRDPQAPPGTYSLFPYSCDGVGNAADAYPWPRMTLAARANAWGIPAAYLMVNACWSGYVQSGVTVPGPDESADYSAASGFPLADRPAIEGTTQNTFVQCRIGGVDPAAHPERLACGPGLTTAADDPASDIPNNQVTAYACLVWSPPLAGVLLIPSSVTLRAVVTEVIHRQQ